MAVQTYSVPVTVPTGTGREFHDVISLQIPDGSLQRTVGFVSCLFEVSIPVTSFTDGGSTSGTYQMVGSIPAGSLLLGTKILVPAGFAGDSSATCIIGDGSDTDRYMTGTPSVFATAATGVECGVPSGSKLITTENRPTITITTGADFTAAVTNASGRLSVYIHYIQLS